MSVKHAPPTSPATGLTTNPGQLLHPHLGPHDPQWVATDWPEHLFPPPHTAGPYAPDVGKVSLHPHDCIPTVEAQWVVCGAQLVHSDDAHPPH